MRTHLKLATALAATVSLQACTAGDLAGLGTIGDLTKAPSTRSGSTFTGGDMGNVAQSNAAAAEAEAAGSSKSSDNGPSSQPGTAGIGLSTFFDSYNYNFPIPAGQSLGAVANASQTALGTAGGRVYLQVGLQTTDRLPTSRSPLNISFVFDRSGSMEGEKIEYSRLAAASMIDALGEQDRFSLVTFDTSVSTLLAPAFVVDKESMKARVAGIRSAGSTNIDGGLREGYKHVDGGYDPSKINRVILMSDGEANVGITDPQTLGQRAADFASKGICLTTIGVGTGFDESFMTHLATQGRGTFYFVNSPSDAQVAFAGEVKSLQRIVARDVKLAINLADGVQLKQVYGHTAETAGQSLNIDSNDLIAAASKVLLLELEVPGGTAGEERAIASVNVDFNDVTYGGTKVAAAEAKVRYTADEAEQAKSRDNQIASGVISLQTATIMLSAASRLDDGDTAGAKKVLNDQLALVTTKADELNDPDLKDLAASLNRYVTRLGSDSAEILKKELQFEAFQMQQGKKAVAAQ